MEEWNGGKVKRVSAFKTYEEIAAWREGRELVKELYAITSGGAFSHDLGLRDQMQRAAVSICSNIAEGFERRGNKEFIRFLWIVKGSAAEVSSQCHHALDLHYVSQEQFDDLFARAKKIGAMLYRLIVSIPDPDRLR